MTKLFRLTCRSLFGFSAFLVTVAVVGPAAASERYAAIVIDAQTQATLHDDMADEERYPASLTKMMTLYMLFDAIERGEVRLSERLPVSRFASQQPPSKLGLRRGETIRVEDAIRALVTKSANDIAVVVAERLGGSESRFAAQMTARARDLGMTSTRFTNASGLPDTRQVTTARDMATLSAALLRDFPQHYGYFATESWTFRSRANRNHNRLLGEVAGMDGIKTGYTRASGFNLASSVVRDGRRIIAVVMGGETAATRNAQMAHLIEMSYEQIAFAEGKPSATFVSLPVNRVTIEVDAAQDEEGEDSGEAPAPDQEAALRGDARLEQGSADRMSYTVSLEGRVSGSLPAPAAAAEY